MQEICKLSKFYIFPNATAWLHFSSFLNIYLDLENYYNVNLPRVRSFAGKFDSFKTLLFLFQKFIEIGQKNTWQILMFFKMATALKTDQINERYLNWLKKTSWGQKISYRQVHFLMLRPKLYRLGTIILSCVKQLLILLG